MRKKNLYTRVYGMIKDDNYYAQLLEYARCKTGSYKELALSIGAPSGAAVEAWRRNGVAHKWRPMLERKFGASMKKSLSGATGQGKSINDHG